MYTHQKKRMNGLLWLMIGIITGILAYILDRTLSEGGVIGLIVVATAGAFVGNVLGSLLLEGNIIRSHPLSLAIVVIGAIGLLLVRKAEQYI